MQFSFGLGPWTYKKLLRSQLHETTFRYTLKHNWTRFTRELNRIIYQVSISSAIQIISSNICCIVDLYTCFDLTTGTHARWRGMIKIDKCWICYSEQSSNSRISRERYFSLWYVLNVLLSILPQFHHSNIDSLQSNNHFFLFAVILIPTGFMNKSWLDFYTSRNS